MTPSDHLPLPPLAPGLPILGNALSMKGDLQAFFVRHYRMLGPIFRVRALSQAFTVIAGAEANRFFRSQGEEFFSSQDSMGGLNDEFNMRVHVLTGRPHRHLRKRLGSGLSRDLVAGRWDLLVTLTERRINAWRAGKTVPVVDQFQRLATEQLSSVLTGAAVTTAQFDLLRRAFELVLDVNVTGKWPTAALRLPTYRKARARVLAFAHAALAERAAHPHGGLPDLLDHALAASDENGRPYPPELRAGMALQGYFGGINTSAYLYGFMLYALLRHPDLLARVTAEVDGVLAGGRLSFDALRDLKTLQGLVSETLRMYPPAPASARTAVQAFQFNGFRVDAGTRVIVATTVPHHLAEHYSDPQAFDIDRNFTEKRRNDVYAPFSVGSHTCLGAGMTETLAVATIAILVRTVRLRLPSPDYQLSIQATPGPNPGRRFRVTVLGPRPA